MAISWLLQCPRGGTEKPEDAPESTDGPGQEGRSLKALRVVVYCERHGHGAPSYPVPLLDGGYIDHKLEVWEEGRRREGPG